MKDHSRALNLGCSGLFICALCLMLFADVEQAVARMYLPVEVLVNVPPEAPESAPGVAEEKASDVPASQPAARRGGRGGGRGVSQERGAERPSRGRSGRGPERGQRGAAQRGDHGRQWHMMDRILPLIAEGHPELAQRLEKMREESPEQFDRIVADALAIRFDEALSRDPSRHDDPSAPAVGDKPDHPEGPPQWDKPLHGPDAPPPPDDKVDELHRREQQLDQETTALAEQYRILSDDVGQEAEQGRRQLRQEIEQRVREHFQVRTELRTAELQHLEHELQRLREMMGRIGRDLKRREAERGVIIERRVADVIGENDQ